MIALDSDSNGAQSCRGAGRGANFQGGLTYAGIKGDKKWRHIQSRLLKADQKYGVQRTGQDTWVLDGEVQMGS